MSLVQKIALLVLVLGLAGRAWAGDVEDAFARGAAAYEQGNYQLALREYRAALDWPGPHTVRAHYNVGACHFQLRQLPAAVTSYRAALKAAPRYVAAAYALGLALAEQGADAEALAAFSNAVEWSQGRHAGALTELGTRLTLAGDYPQAETRLRQASNLAGPHKPMAHNNLGVILARTGRLAEAETEFLTAHQLSAARLPVALSNLQLCRRLLRSQTSAAAHWQLARSGGPQANTGNGSSG